MIYFFVKNLVSKFVGWKGRHISGRPGRHLASLHHSSGIEPAAQFSQAGLSILANSQP